MGYDAVVDLDAEPHQGLATACFIRMGVDLLGGRDMRAPKNDLRFACLRPGVFEQ